MEENYKISLNVFALVGFIFGILSLFFYWLFAIIPTLAIIFSIIGLVGINKKKQKGIGLATTGLVLGILYILAFGINISLISINKTVKNTNSQIVQNSSNIIYSKNDLIGEWQYFKSDENSNSFTDERINFYNDYTFLYSNLLYFYGEKEQPFHAELTGTYSFSNNTIIIYINGYTKNSNPEWANFFVGQNRKFELKDNKIFSISGSGIYVKK